MQIRLLISALAVFTALSFTSYGAEEESSLILKTQAPGNVFTDKAKASFTNTLKDSGEKLRYQLKDWQGNTLSSGECGDKLEFPLLPCGYYRIFLSSDKREFKGEAVFTVVPSPEKRSEAKDIYFAIDTAQSEQAGPRAKNTRMPKDAYAVASELSSLAGMKLIRDRMHWDNINQNPGEYKWGVSDYNMGLLDKRGIQVVPMFEQAPKWARGDSKRLPDDLFALYEFTKSGASYYKGKMPAWEIYNEQDVGKKLDVSAWDFAAVQKVGYLGLKAGNPEMNVLGGSLCRYPLPYFTSLLFKNDFADYMDTFNFHIYNRIEEYPGIVKGLRDFLAQYRAGDRPIWITENGSNYEGSAKVQSYMGGLMEHDYNQKLILAEFVPKAQITLQYLGIGKDFMFMLVPYNERNGQKPWGILHWDYTAKPAYAAFSNLVYQLADAECLGRCKIGDGLKAYLYQKKDGSQTLVYWSESELDKNGKKIDTSKKFEKNFTIAAAQGKYTISDLLGKTSELESKDGKLELTATRFPEYLSGLKNMKTDESAKSTGKAYQPDPAKDLSIIVKAVLMDKLEAKSKTSADLSGDESKIKIEVYNFSDKEKTGSLRTSGKGSLEGVPAKITVAPFSKTVIDCVYKPNFDKNSFKSDLDITGEFDGKKISSFYMPVASNYAIKKNSVESEIPLADPKRWHENSSGKMSISYDESEKAVKFDVNFKNADNKWVYPEYILNDSESFAGVRAVSFEIKAVQSKKDAAFGDAVFMAVTEKQHETGKSVWLQYPHPTSEWQTMTVNLEDAPENFKASDVKMFRIGMNPSAEECTFWIRNVKVMKMAE